MARLDNAGESRYNLSFKRTRRVGLLHLTIGRVSFAVEHAVAFGAPLSSNVRCRLAT